MFSIVFYSKTIRKQKKLSEWVNPERSSAEIWHRAFSYSVDSNCKHSLETYFVLLNHITSAPTEVVDLTAFMWRGIESSSHLLCLCKIWVNNNPVVFFGVQVREEGLELVIISLMLKRLVRPLNIDHQRIICERKNIS